MRDYYDVLGVPKASTQDQIKKAYRDLALKYHPDRNKSADAESKFKEINEAYAVLGNPEKRQRYDTYGPEQFGQRYSEEDIFRGFNFQDIFRDIGLNVDFGMGSDPGGMFSRFFGQQPGPEQGRSLLYRLDLRLEEVAEGAKKDISVKHVRACGSCGGSGAEPGSKVIKCNECRGAGRVRRTSNTLFGQVQVVSACDRCSGTGKVHEKSCRHCGGTGGEVATEKVNVDIPAGVSDGMRLRLEGMGDYSRYGKGDLYIEINTLPHTTFKRDGDNILASVTIPFYLAILGGEAEVPTLKGGKKVFIEPGTQPNVGLLIKGHGVRRFRGSSYGDEIVTINVEMPKVLSAEERDLIERFRTLRDGSEGDPKKRFWKF